METEAKYPEEHKQGWSKDDEKETTHIRDLERKFQSTDYSAASGLSPAERLTKMNRDINQIVIEREDLAQKQQKRADAAWWKEEREGKHGGEDKKHESSTAIRSDPTSRMDPNQIPVGLSGVEKGQQKLGGSESKLSDREVALPATTRQGRQERELSMGRSDQAGGQGRDKLAEDQRGGFSSIFRGGASKERPIGRDKLESGEQGELNRGDFDPSVVKVGSTSPYTLGSGPELTKEGMKAAVPFAHATGPILKGQSGGFLGGDTVESAWNKQYRRQKEGLDRTKRERQEFLEQNQISQSDPDNKRSDSDIGRLWTNNLNASMDRAGEVKRVKQSSSTAFSPVAGAMEDQDVTRTHTRRGSDRVLTLGKKDALLSQRDFERSMQAQQAGMDRAAAQRLSGSTDGVGPMKETHDFLDSAGSWWNKSYSVPKSTTQQLQQQTILSREPIVRSERGSSIAQDMKASLRDTKERVEDKADETRDKLEDHYASARDRLEDTLESTKEKLEEWKSRVVEKKDEISSKVKGKAEEVKQDAAEAAQEAKLKGAQLKQDVELKSRDVKEDVEAKGRGMKAEMKDAVEDVEARGRSVKQKIENKAAELKQDAKEEWRDIKDDVRHMKARVKDSAESLKDKIEDGAEAIKDRVEGGVERASGAVREKAADAREEVHELQSKARRAWWNPMRLIRGSEYTIEQRPVRVDATPQYVHIERDLKKAPRAPSILEPIYPPRENGDRIMESGSSAVTKDGIYMPASLRGLEGGTDLPQARLELPASQRTSSMAEKGIYVPNSLRGLEDSEDISNMPSSAPAKRASSSWVSRGHLHPIHVPNSLRGLEDSEDMPSYAIVHEGEVSRERLQELPKPNALKGDLEFKQTSLQAKPRGFLTRMFGGRGVERQVNTTHVSAPQEPMFDSPLELDHARRPVTDNVSRSQSDLLMGRSGASRQRSSAASDLRSNLGGNSIRDSNIDAASPLRAVAPTPYLVESLSERQFKELMVETME